MKRCPQCNRVEPDDALGFCRVDGATLVTGPLSDSESTTAIFDTTTPSSESTTRNFAPHTNEGISRTTGPTTSLPSQHFPSHTRPLARSGRGKILLAVGGLFVVALGLSAYFFAGSTRHEAISSVAVLPFADRSGNSESEYLSDGLAESLIYRLSQLPNLKVSPTSSVMRYKGKEVDVQKIAADLGVDAVLSGRMVQRDENLMISVELIDARTNRLLWGEQFERKMSELMMTQREIATAISQKLQLKLSGEETGLTKRYTSNNEAYTHYLKGRFYWNKRTAESVGRGIEQFTTAVQKDPGFALAYAGLADCYAILANFGGGKLQENVALAKSNALKATELDPELAEPHATLGMLHHFEWRTAEAEAEFKRALDLNPNYATAHQWYGRLLRSMGRDDEAWTQMKQANTIDPLSLVVLNNIAELQLDRGNLEEAEGICKKMLDLEPNFWAGHHTIAVIFTKQQRYDEALAEAQKGVELNRRANSPLALLAHVYGRMGKRTEAEAVIKELQDRYATESADGRDLAVAYAGLGQKDVAFGWLEKSFQQRSPFMSFLRMETLLDPVKSDPRWNELLKRVGV